MPAFAFLRLQSDFAKMMLDAQTVISLRVMGMSGVIPALDGENARMIDEKPDAWIDAWAAGTQALIDGQRTVDVMTAGLAPLNDKVRANRQRLMK